MSNWLGISRPGSRDDGRTLEPVQVPVRLQREGERPCLVVGFDHRPNAEAALRWAAELATPLQADLHIVHVVDIADAGPDPDASDWEAQTTRCVEAQQHQASEMLADFPGHWTYQTRRGQPSRVLSNLANEKHALMIIVGARRTGILSTIAGWFDRSVASQLVQKPLQVPVLLVGPGR